MKACVDLIIAGRGTNILVESHRGLKAKLDLPELPNLDNEMFVEDKLKKIDNEEAELVEQYVRIWKHFECH